MGIAALNPRLHVGLSPVGEMHVWCFGLAAWILPRSCRGDWKVARNTNHAKTQHIPARGCRDIYVISGRTAGELPLAPTLHVCCFVVALWEIAAWGVIPKGDSLCLAVG